MSRKLVAMVYDRRVGSVHRKAVLAYFADRASDNGKGVWASKQTIANETECGRSTVIKTVNAFLAEGLIREVGAMPCTNGSTVIYDLNVGAIEALPLSKSSGKGSTSGTSPDVDPSTSGTPPVHQRDPEGSTSGTQTVLEPSLNQEIPPIPPAPEETPLSVLCEVATKEAVSSFLSYRTKTRKSPMTLTGAARLAKQLKILIDAGCDPSDALGEAEERGWKSVKAEWILKEKKNGQSRNIDGSGAAMAQRAGERFAARYVDSGQGPDTVVPLLPARQSR